MVFLDPKLSRGSLLLSSGTQSRAFASGDLGRSLSGEKSQDWGSSSKEAPVHEKPGTLVVRKGRAGAKQRMHNHSSGAPGDCKNEHIRKYLMKKLMRWWWGWSKRMAAKAQSWVGRFGCALFWSSYVCAILLGLLATGFVFGSLMMRQLVVHPLHISETLTFDYTRASPVASVPLTSMMMPPLSGVGDPSPTKESSSAEAQQQVGAPYPVIPYNHKLRITVSLTLPESDYNWKLGVRLDLVSARGKVTGSSVHPCMLRFKSQPIRSAPLIAGLQSESQTLKVRMDETSSFTKVAAEPTTFLRVILEPRAEFKDIGAGLPQIYAASVLIESQLPHLTRLVWLWHRTILVWISISLFLTQLIFTLVFCPNILIPGGKPPKKSQ
ncbi:hypothetical protein Tsubulata_016363, partial [Turnera subulata]